MVQYTCLMGPRKSVVPPMTKKVYLVDTENVNSTWKELLPEITKTDRMILFYTANSPHISYGDLGFILQYPDTFEMMECYTANTGLDFQLVSYLGYLLKTAAKTEYIIVSNDTGYDAVIHFWTDRERKVCRLTSAELIRRKQAAHAQKEEQPKPKPQPSSKKTTPPAPEPQEPQTPEGLVEKALGKECSQADREWILEMLGRCNVQQFSLIHSELQKKFGQEQGVVYYKRLRTILRRFYGLKAAAEKGKKE